MPSFHAFQARNGFQHSHEAGATSARRRQMAISPRCTEQPKIRNKNHASWIKSVDKGLAPYS